MVAPMFKTPSTSDIYNATTTVVAAATTTCAQHSLGKQSGTPCEDTDLGTDLTSRWYDGGWTTPAAWLILVYCIVSAATMLLLMCHGILDWRLNLDFSRAAANQREMRRRRRNSRRFEDWNERERQEAEEVETDMDEESGEWEERLMDMGFREDGNPPTLHGGLADRQRQAIRQRQERDIRVLARLERAGLI